MPRALTWDLSKLLPSLDPKDTEPALKDVEAKVTAVESWRPKLDGIKDASEVERLLGQLSDMEETLHRVSSRASLAFACDTNDEQAAAFLARIENLEADVDSRTMFARLWWKQLPDARAAALMPKDPDLRHYAGRLRLFAKHTLSEPEERILSIKSVTGSTALDKVREILASNTTYVSPTTGKDVTQSELMRGAHSHDPDVRVKTYDELWRLWSKQEQVLSTLYQAVVNDWYNEQVTLRKYPSSQTARNMWNDVPDEAVKALLEVCRENAPLFQRYFMWKGKRLGIEKMSRYHVYAPLRTAEEKPIDYDAAADTVLDTLDAFDRGVGDLARRVFDEQHVDVLPRAGKRSGAFCATVNSTMTPFLFLNHTGDRSSVKTLAHEMGHAVHSMLAEHRHPLVAHSGLPMAETASVFSEMLMHDRMMKAASGEERTQILSDKVAEIYATVMRQAYFARFEVEAHEAIRNGATTQEVHALYLENLREQFGPVDVPEKWKHEWTYIPHFYASPFYVYAYSFGMLLSLALYDMYRTEGASFVPKYKKILGAGGDVSPRPLLMEALGVDINDKAFWRRGFAVVDEMVKELGA